MAKLLEYSNLNEKKDWFDSGIVTNFLDFEIMLKKIEEEVKSGGYIFRGCAEAKYKIYNSAQRHCITNDLYTQVASIGGDIENHYVTFISNLIDESKNWNNGVVKNLFKSSKIDPNNAVAYLSLMQHFSIPSPFLDFTYDPYVALFFAIDNLNRTASNNQIDNYFSLYFTNTERSEFEAWEAFRKTNFPGVNTSYPDLSSCRILVIEQSNPDNQIVNNLNIVNQQGLFFYNSYPLQPLEEAYANYVTQMRSNLGLEKFKNSSIASEFVSCFNIHK